MPIDAYTQFVAKYPVFGDTVFGGRQAYTEAYNLASVYVAYFENIGLDWGGFKQVATEFKTACILQNIADQKSGSLASINTPTDSQKIKQVSVEGEYTVEYESPGSISSKQLEINAKHTGYYCEEFNNLKDLLFANQLSETFLYSHEYFTTTIQSSSSTQLPNIPVTGEIAAGSTYSRTFSQTNLDVANILVVFHELNTTVAQVTIKNNNNESIIPDRIVYGDANTIYIELASYTPLIGIYTVLVSR